MLAIVSVALSVIGPKILGHATDIIFTGCIGRRLPAGATKAEAVEAAAGHGQTAHRRHGRGAGPRAGPRIDFDALGQVLLLASWPSTSAPRVFSWLQGRLTTVVVQRTVSSCATRSRTKLRRLPLSYFDSKPRGEVLSRVTNDIDNIAQSLQQTMSQLLTSLLTIVGVLAMMFCISPLLAADRAGDRAGRPWSSR